MPGRIVIRLPMEQTEAGAEYLGKAITEGLQGLDLLGCRRLSLSDVTREAVVLYLNRVNGSRMRAKDLIAVDNIPIHLDNSLRFGDVWEEL